jgi:hypothetical protein
VASYLRMIMVERRTSERSRSDAYGCRMDSWSRCRSNQLGTPSEEREPVAVLAHCRDRGSIDQVDIRCRSRGAAGIGADEADGYDVRCDGTDPFRTLQDRLDGAGQLDWRHI